MSLSREVPMSVPLSFVRHQLPMLKAFGRTAAIALRQRVVKPRGTPELPGPILRATLPPRSPALIEAYLAHVSGRAGSGPATWGRFLPTHLFPQWGFPLLQAALEPIPYPLMDLLNGGCRMVVRRGLPIDEPLDVTAQLVRIDDDGRRAIMHLRLITGTASAPEALEVDFQAIVRLRGPKQDKGDKSAAKAKPTVPEAVEELARWSLGPRAGLDFALLTGDFNPIHWVPLAARAAGFKSTILHGFASMGRVAEALIARELGGREVPGLGLRGLDVRFVAPLVLPAEVGLYRAGHEVWVGGGAGGPAFMTGSYELAQG